MRHFFLTVGAIYITVLQQLFLIAPFYYSEAGVYLVSITMENSET